MKTKQIVNHQHDYWAEFAMRMIEEDGCSQRFDLAIEILNIIPSADIPGTLAWFKQRGANCDCEIVSELILPMFDDPPKFAKEDA